MKKQLTRKDPSTWGVKDRIPATVLEEMLKTPGFVVSYVYQRAASQMDGILWVYATRGIRSFHPIRYRELQNAALDFMLEHLSDDGSGDNVYYLGGILESAFIIEIMDERLRELDEDDLGLENLNMAKGSRRRGSRVALWFVK